MNTARLVTTGLTTNPRKKEMIHRQKEYLYRNLHLLPRFITKIMNISLCLTTHGIQILKETHKLVSVYHYQRSKYPTQTARFTVRRTRETVRHAQVNQRQHTLSFHKKPPNCRHYGMSLLASLLIFVLVFITGRWLTHRNSECRLLTKT
jgi:hypothetical protein